MKSILGRILSFIMLKKAVRIVTKALKDWYLQGMVFASVHNEATYGEVMRPPCRSSLFHAPTAQVQWKERIVSEP
jgi:hypothetical protein